MDALLTELFTTGDGFIAVAATLVGVLLPLGFHLFIRHKMRESEREQLSQTRRASSSDTVAATPQRDPHTTP